MGWASLKQHLVAANCGVQKKPAGLLDQQYHTVYIFMSGWHKVREPGSSIAKDLIDSEDPKHTLFCRETAFVAIYALFKG